MATTTMDMTGREAFITSLSGPYGNLKLVTRRGGGA
jgi:hypothetical protein